MGLPAALAAMSAATPQAQPQPQQPPRLPAAALPVNTGQSAPSTSAPVVRAAAVPSALPSADAGSAAAVVDQKPQMADPFADVSIPPQPVVVFPDDVEELLDEGCALFPVVADKRGQAVLPYSYAKSDDSFRAWNLGKRKSTEWQRARKVREFVRSRIQLDIPTKKVVLWCRQHNKVPSVEVSVEVEIPVVRHCKFCGRTHLPLESFKATQKLCRQRLGETAIVSTLTPWKHVPTSPGSSVPPSPPPAALQATTTSSSSSSSSDVISPATAPSSGLMAVKPEPIEMDVVKDPINAHLAEVRTKLYEHFRDRPFLAGEIPKMLEEIDIPLDTNTAQGHVVENLLCKLAFSFARDLVRDSLIVCRGQEKARAGGPHEGVSLVPYHVFCAVRNNPQLDFLTNHGMANPVPVIIEENPFAAGDWETVYAAPVSPPFFASSLAAHSSTSSSSSAVPMATTSEAPTSTSSGTSTARPAPATSATGTPTSPLPLPLASAAPLPPAASAAAALPATSTLAASASAASSPTSSTQEPPSSAAPAATSSAPPSTPSPPSPLPLPSTATTALPTSTPSSSS